MAGGGIYFAVSVADTDHKALAHGPVLECRVKLGRVKTIARSGDRTITFKTLLDEGYDSVLIHRSGAWRCGLSGVDI